MINGTLSAVVSDNSTVVVTLSTNTPHGSSNSPTVKTFGFCDKLERVDQDDGVYCPPTKGDVQISAWTIPWFLWWGDIIDVQIEGLTPDNETITCLNATLEIAGLSSMPGHSH